MASTRRGISPLISCQWCQASGSTPRRGPVHRRTLHTRRSVGHSVMPEDGFSLCQCELCRGQATLDRDPSGFHSDYVWGFVARVAKELAKTHPDKKVFCGAYSSYRLPPRSIAHPCETSLAPMSCLASPFMQ